MYYMFGIFLPSFYWWHPISPWIKRRVKFIKSNPPSVSGLIGTAYIADKSRHPV